MAKQRGRRFRLLQLKQRTVISILLGCSFLIALRSIVGVEDFTTIARVEVCKRLLDYFPRDPTTSDLRTIRSARIPYCVILYANEIRNPDLTQQLETVCHLVTKFKAIRYPKFQHAVRNGHIELNKRYVNESELLVVEDDAILKDSSLLLWEYKAFAARGSSFFQPEFNGWDTHSYRFGTVAYLSRPQHFLGYLEENRCRFDEAPIDICISKYECFPSCSSCPFSHGKYASLREEDS